MPNKLACLLFAAALAGCNTGVDPEPIDKEGNTPVNPTNPDPVDPDPVDPDPVDPDPVDPDPVDPDPVDPDPVDPDPVGPNLTQGKSSYTLMCTNCHGDGLDQGIFQIASADFAVYTQDSLSAYIAEKMPRKVPGLSNYDAADCVDDCAENIAGFMLNGFSDENGNPDPVDPDPVDPDPVDPIAQCDQTVYGPRQLRVLTRTEYQNTVEDLFGVNFNVSNRLPSDTQISDFDNHSFLSISDSRLDAYSSIAQDIAEWAEGRDYAGIIDCSSLSYNACTDSFLTDVATKVLREPLTSDEKAAFNDLFSNSLTGGDKDQAIHLGLEALLTHYKFLYRNEMGLSRDDYVASLTSGNLIDDPSGHSVTVSAAQFSKKSTGKQNDGESSWNIYSNGYIENSFAFDGQNIVTVTMKGEPAKDNMGGEWPEMELVINGDVVDSVLVDSDRYSNYVFEVSGISGNQTLQVSFLNDYYAQGVADRNLHVASVTVSEAIANTTEAGFDYASLDSDAYILSDYQYASYLSYTFAGTTPDDTLLAATAAGELHDKSKVEAQISRLLATQRGEQQLEKFVNQWLGTDTILSKVKDDATLTSNIREAMAQEPVELFKHIFYNPTTATFSEFYDSDYVFVNSTLAQFYGLSGVSGNNFTKVSANTDRGGILTTGAFLGTYAYNNESSPIHRAVAIRERMLCQEVLSPPSNLGDDRKELIEQVTEELANLTVTKREEVQRLTEIEGTACVSCHVEIINPLGFGLEDYDELGRKRTQDTNNLSINANGTLHFAYGIADTTSLGFHGAKALSGVMAENPSTESCFAAKAFRFAMNTGHLIVDSTNDVELSSEELEQYQCAVNELSAHVSQASPQSMFIELGTNTMSRFRKQRDR